VPKVKPERSNWRDPELFPRINKGLGISSGWETALSLRHRDWGWNCPAVDIDFILVSGDNDPVEGGMIFVEYTNHVAVAIVEYKVEGASPTSYSRRNAICSAIRLELPIFEVFYTPDFSSFRVTCWVGGCPDQTFTESGFKNFLEKLRKTT
jgi:hypothetical protein